MYMNQASLPSSTSTISSILSILQIWKLPHVPSTGTSTGTFSYPSPPPNCFYKYGKYPDISLSNWESNQGKSYTKLDVKTFESRLEPEFPGFTKEVPDLEDDQTQTLGGPGDQGAFFFF